MDEDAAEHACQQLPAHQQSLELSAGGTEQRTPAQEHNIHGCAAQFVRCGIPYRRDCGAVRRQRMIVAMRVNAVFFMIFPPRVCLAEPGQLGESFPVAAAGISATRFCGGLGVNTQVMLGRIASARIWRLWCPTRAFAGSSVSTAAAVARS